MMRLYDTSAIMNLIMTHPERVRVLAGDSILDLTRYEMGNVIWKKIHVNHKPLAECITIMQHMLIILNSMKSLNAMGMEQEVLTVAEQYDMSYYDTAYVVTAMKNGLDLITDDGKMERSARQYGVSVYSSNVIGI